MSTGWQLGGKVIDLGAPRIMAIVNATPDSFFTGSRLAEATAERGAALRELIEAGADIIDIGGQSTRPGSERVGPAEELRRVVPVVEELRRIDAVVPITVDTYHAAVARAALDAGADGINDISAGRMDEGLLPLVGARGCGYVLMHMQGTPESMQSEPYYADCLAEIRSFFEEQLVVLDVHGIARERVALDPGVGFGKRLEDNIALLNGAAELVALGLPLLYGISRKSFIATLSGEQETDRRLSGTLGVTWALLSQGVMLHRVHDTAEVRQLMAVWRGLR